MQNRFENHTAQIKQLSNENLLSQTKLLGQKERNIHIQILHHLAETDSRKLYFKRGFSSLFDYAVKELGYSEGAAYRRIKAMKLCRDMPETKNRLLSGRLSLSTACELQVFFEKQARKARTAKKTELQNKKQPVISDKKIQEIKEEKIKEAVTSPVKETERDGIS